MLGVSHSCFIAWFVPSTLWWYLEGWIFLPFSAVGMTISWRSSHMDIRVGNVWTCSCLDLCHVKWKPCYNVFDVLINTVHQETRTTVYFNCVQNSGLKTILQSKGTQSWWGIMDEPKRRRRDPTGIPMLGFDCFCFLFFTFFVLPLWVNLNIVVSGYGNEFQRAAGVGLVMDLLDFDMYERSCVFRFCATKKA